ncbi:hypothetical protein P261_00292 [Lachnospiraceae bacterium TWA4]|nr:hypothetical protein P261_00292 [Lachnospiraceae bacterium TWA4]
MKQINEDIKTREFKKVYLIYGEEGYLTRQFTDKLMKAIAPNDTMNCTCFKEKSVEVSEVISIADTLPFFTEKRVVVVEDSGFFKRDSSDFAEYLPHMPETTCLIFKESEIDRRNKLYKKVKELGYCAEMKRQTERGLERWVLGLLSKEEIQISKDALEYFLQSVGTDMSLLKNELEKLVCYIGDRKFISKEDIDTICSIQITGHIFDMIDAISAHNQKRAMKLYYDLVALREPAMRILYLINRQYLQLYQVKELAESGMNENEIGKAAGLSSYVVKKVLQKASKLTKKELEYSIEKCVKADEGIKTGLIKDQMAVELLIVELSK